MLNLYGLDLTPYETRRLILRPLSQEDEEDTLRIFGDDPEMTWHHASWNLDNVRYVLNLRMAHYARYGFGVHAIVDKATGEMIGQGGLQVMDAERVEFVIYIERRRWRGGLGAEVGSAVIARAFRTSNLREIFAATRPDNLAIRKLLSRLNFSQVGSVNHYDLEALLWATSSSEWLVMERGGLPQSPSCTN